jgi:hypothetical protein
MEGIILCEVQEQILLTDPSVSKGHGWQNPATQPLIAFACFSMWLCFLLSATHSFSVDL